MASDVRALSDLDDEALVERSRRRDQAAFEELVRRHADRLFAVVLRLCVDAHEAEEVTQEAFLRAWRGIERFERRSQFFTWLYRIGVNEAKRRAERRPAAGQLLSLDADAVGEAPD
jgi:RNA polymerase sigma-70 factor (ECF subfamily)